MIIDCHAHLLPSERMAKLIRWTQRFNPSHTIPETVALETLLEGYAEVKVSSIWNFAHAIFPEETDSLNDWNWRLGQSHPQIIPFGTCHPLSPDPWAVIDRCFSEYRFVGIKFHPFVQRFTPWEERFFPLYERIASHGGIAIFHTGFEEFYGGSLPLAGFEAILRACPQLIVVFTHANYPRVREAFDLVARYPNLYLDTVHVFAGISRSWEPGRDQLTAWAELREGLFEFPDRVMFGTDHPSGAGTLQEIYQEFRGFDLPQELEQQLLGVTARRLIERVRRS
ncbi:MAG: amidohydrolase family protein [Candidatus Rokubacteria bacterium]|nr:amidohydrolase family protein [Candidatus Rokubacteria bacterium]